MEHHSGDFSVTVRDVRQLTQPESDLLTLLWVLEGSVNLAVAEGASQPLVADGLAIVNRNRRWSLRSAGANAVMILTLSASWLARLDNAFFAVDYQITPRTRDADDGLRRLMRQAGGGAAGINLSPAPRAAEKASAVRGARQQQRAHRHRPQT